MSDSEKTRISVRMARGLNRAIEDQLGYDDTKAEWVREAIRMRLTDETDSTE